MTGTPMDRYDIERIRLQRRRARVRYWRGVVMGLGIGTVGWLFLILALAGFVVLLNRG